MKCPAQGAGNQKEGKMTRGILFVLGISLSLAGPALGEIYRWTDREGKLHFSDKPPHLETQKIDLFVNDGIKPLPREGKPARDGREKESRKKEARKVLRAEDYQINFSTAQRGDELTISGRIGNGPECPSLKVTMHVQDQRGNREKVVGMVSNVGYGRSDLLDARTRVPAADFRNEWTITDIDVYCRQ